MSLYVTIECSKLIQIYLIHQDLKMWDDTCDKGVECRALNIPEELGQVSFIKTRQNGLQNNWLLRACIANIQEIEQHLPSIQGIISHTKDRHKMCGPPKFF